jgi:predicted methyltransferase
MAGITRRFALAAPVLGWSVPAFAADTLAAAIANPGRSPRNIARDRYRHPAAMLAFFGLRATQSVLEIQPGGGYWTEILAPYLAPSGSYTAAVPPPPSPEWAGFLKFLAAASARYNDVRVTALSDTAPLGPPGSVDLVLSCRNLHDWMADGTAQTKLRAIYAVLKPGGVLGMEDHRGLPTQPQDPRARSGYVREDDAKTLIETAGFRLVATSQIGDNPRDLKNYPAGVWTLPPVLRLGAVDRAKYLAIGESDRWTMKFVKPVA